MSSMPFEQTFLCCGAIGDPCVERDFSVVVVAGTLEGFPAWLAAGFNAVGSVLLVSPYAR